jgi:hypothetical protein
VCRTELTKEEWPEQVTQRRGALAQRQYREAERFKTKENTEMMNAMVCHIAEGELTIVQDGKRFTGKKNYVWTCNMGTKEHVINESNAVGIMRITDLKA